MSGRDPGGGTGGGRRPVEGRSECALESGLASELGDKGEECKPGAPMVTFHSAPSVLVEAINNQPHTGLFSLACPILEGDTANTITRRICRLERNLKGKLNI